MAPEPTRPNKRAKRGARPAIAARGLVRVDADFETEYPGSSAGATECYASLVRVGVALAGELDRRLQHSLGLPQPTFTALAVIDGASEPLTPSEISARALGAAAAMTATLDALEYRGWIRRMPNPDDRRSVLVEITDEGRVIADRVLPGIRDIELRTMVGLTESEQRELLRLLDKVLAHAAEIATEDPVFAEGTRARRPH